MLNNTLYRLLHDKRLTVGYLGGSITEGTGASSPERCWRGLTTAWLKATFPDCRIDEVNAAIGGTGSSLGIYRMDKDLLSKSPNLVFVEFTVNDASYAFDEILSDSETIVRKIYEKDPTTEIIYVHTATKFVSTRISAGMSIPSRTAHSAVMYHYGIPQINVGEILRSRIISEGVDWQRYTTDTTHPNDEGYRIYADTICEFLGKALLGKSSVGICPRAVPSPLRTDKRIGAQLVDARVCANDAWTLVENKTLCGRYPSFIEATTPDAELEFCFKGSRVGIYVSIDSDSGDIVYSVDGGVEKTMRIWEISARNFSRVTGKLLSDDLAHGDHVLRLRVAHTKSEEATGTAVRIGAFMVY